MKYWILLSATILLMSCEQKKSQMRQDAMQLQERTLTTADSLSKVILDQISLQEGTMGQLSESANLETDTLKLAEFLACKSQLETLETLKTSLEDWKIGATFLEQEGNPHKTNKHFEKNAADQDVMNAMKKNASALEDLRLEITTAIQP